MSTSSLEALYIVWCKNYFAVLNPLGVDHECHGETDVEDGQNNLEK